VFLVTSRRLPIISSFSSSDRDSVSVIQTEANKKTMSRECVVSNSPVKEEFSDRRRKVVETNRRTAPRQDLQGLQGALPGEHASMTDACRTGPDR
jgi:hypothetical protein